MRESSYSLGWLHPDRIFAECPRNIVAPIAGHNHQTSVSFMRRQNPRKRTAKLSRAIDTVLVLSEFHSIHPPGPLEPSRQFLVLPAATNGTS